MHHDLLVLMVLMAAWHSGCLESLRTRIVVPPTMAYTCREARQGAGLAQRYCEGRERWRPVWKD